MTWRSEVYYVLRVSRQPFTYRSPKKEKSLKRNLQPPEVLSYPLLYVWDTKYNPDPSPNVRLSSEMRPRHTRVLVTSAVEHRMRQKRIIKNALKIAEAAIPHVP